MPIRINRVYTRGGDQGETSLVGGQRIGKDALRIESYGTVDELNSIFGIVRATLRDPVRVCMSPDDRSYLDSILQRIQNELFNLGSDLATLPADRHPNQPRIEPRHIGWLEDLIDKLNEGLPELTSFILPGGGPLSAFLHQARTVCRRAERIVTALSREEPVENDARVYLNRLSDLLFVLGRWAAHASGEAETLWDPSRS
ncbi:MAG: cob(I)yrinic acid a,c-diamide adenosyltransferase [Acidobacteria bacterium]|nr:cob(I)yrinic acid a,c-diamide adenosyltransferase [Acidobacteriota bacterium]MCG3191523.1 Cob(I)yrinic acid a,c-diamide adenosyltransferase [Thermoanaerobaculia bacterium]